MIASEKPRSNITSARITYMMPIRLWSVVVIHSRHRYGHQPLSVTRIKRPRIPESRTHTVISGIGWAKGTADHVNFPNILITTLDSYRFRSPGLEALHDFLLASQKSRAQPCHRR